ncbi:1-propanol dehydrogenase PduQ [Vagococcus carniphilus]|uniref:Alcohol dehydrogenase n=1 Tax=Vagococcus carniphilus TaxID=218144 RepID=A0A430B1R2_9ENTE|nr:1-propanol dehydrogenase PduQ [Vagococcus carniphilus]QNN74029.1 iron-containing alcohol dehydrogenase [Vagococcus carniphilus]RSU14191.1 alcohol dehydrogenase [Vagococcus carniphilus]
MNRFIIPTKIYSGADSLSVLQTIKNQKVMMVCDSFLPGTDSLKQIENQLPSCNEVTIFFDVLPDPPLDNIMAGVEVFKRFKPTVMIGIGGGSAIDTAKAIRYFGEKINQENIACFIAIPTTSGTGSEVTNTAVVSDTKNGVKFPIIKDHLTPDIALLDPSLVVSAPKSVTAFSGLDVLTHALEALVAKDSDLFTDALAEKAIDVISNELIKAYENGSDLEARQIVHEASCEAGIAFNMAGLGICHSLAHQLGAKFHVPHGLANAMLLPHVIAFNAQDKESAKKYAEAIKKANVGSPSLSDSMQVKRMEKHIFKMMKAMNCPKTLKEFGISESDVMESMDWIVSHAKEDGTFPGNPIVPNDQELKEIVLKIIK